MAVVSEDRFHCSRVCKHPDYIVLAKTQISMSIACIATDRGLCFNCQILVQYHEVKPPNEDSCHCYTCYMLEFSEIIKSQNLTTVRFLANRFA